MRVPKVNKVTADADPMSRRGERNHMATRNDLISKTNSELIDAYEAVIIELTKVANGWNRKSEAKLGREADKIRSEIIRRMDAAI